MPYSPSQPSATGRSTAVIQRVIALLLLTLALVSAGCAPALTSPPTPTSAPTRLPSPTPIPPTPSPVTPTATPRPTRTATATRLPPSATPTPTRTASASPTALITETASPSATITPVPMCHGYPIPAVQLETAVDPDVYLAGTAYLCNYSEYSAFDFDRAIVGSYFVLDPETNLKGAEIELSLGRGQAEGHIVELEPAELVSDDWGRPPTQEKCETELKDYQDLGLVYFWWYENIPELFYEFACIRTDEGRLGYFHVDELNPLGELSVKLSFVIWKNDQDK